MIRYRFSASVSLLITTLAAAQHVPPAGKWTVIAHGRTGSCDYPANYNALIAASGWMRQLGSRIESLDPGRVNVYSVGWSSLSLSVLNAGGTNPLDASRHHVVLFDWGATSDFDPILCQAPSGNQDGFAFAAGDAMAALLRHWGAADKVFGLIGFSRGSIVVSEAARRLMVGATNPEQVVFIDGEGCEAGGSNGCTFYQDGRFDAWTPPAGSVRFVNIYETLNERYLAPSFCATDLGGHARPRCANINLGTTFAHTNWSLGSACLPSYSQTSILNYAINGITVSAGVYAFAQSPGSVQDPNAPAAGSQPIDPVYNGGLGFASLAGWLGQGGGGTGTISSIGGTPTVRITRGQTRSHNYFALPACASAVSMSAAIEGATPGDSTLRVYMQSPAGPEVLIGSAALSGLASSLGPPMTFAYPPSFAGTVVRLRVAVEGATGSAAAHVAAVGITACAPACYANCDGSTSSPLLTANDFQCFLNRFAAGDGYANCDQSTGAPALTSNDFQCFLNKFAAGCR